MSVDEQRHKPILGATNMEFKDPASYADLAQGRIKHILFRIGVNFSTHILEIEATYEMQEPVQLSLIHI